MTAPILTYNELRGYHRALATDVACQQGALTLLDPWFRSPFVGLAFNSVVETRFHERVMSLLDFSLWIPLSTFSILPFIIMTVCFTQILSNNFDLSIESCTICLIEATSSRLALTLNLSVALVSVYTNLLHCFRCIRIKGVEEGGQGRGVPPHFQKWGHKWVCVPHFWAEQMF